MKRFIPAFMILVLILSVAVAGAAEPVPFHIHFVVVSDTLSDGTSAKDAVAEFEKEVLKLAGGFTEIGSTRGGELVNGAVEYQTSISFMIGADREISKELHELTRKFFGSPGAFIMAWPGTVTY